jgi:hypothetical protein
VEHVRDRYGFQNTTKNREKRKDWREREREAAKLIPSLNTALTEGVKKKKKKKKQKKKKNIFKTGKNCVSHNSWGEINHFVGFTNFRMFFFPGPPTV